MEKSLSKNIRSFMLVWAATSSLLAQESNSSAKPRDADLPPIVMETSIRYGKVGEVDLLLDLARPMTPPAKCPALIYVHGGGWYTGNREQYHNEMREAAERGYVAVTISYRLTSNNPPQNYFPAQIEDVKCAIRWLRTNAAKYFVDPDRIGIKGSSAGGHLALLTGVTDAAQGLEGVDADQKVSSRVQAVINYYGPIDLASLHQSSKKVRTMLEQLLGGTPDAVPQAYSLASPVNHLTSDDPPIMTIHGGKDPLVPLDQAIRLDREAKKAGVAHELLTLPEQAHGFSGEDRAKALAASFEFFDRQLKKSRPNVILLMADDLGWGDPGYMGHSTIQTPNLDEMSRQGFRMNRFYSASPVCSPTRGSCLTGRHPSRYGIRTANDGTLKESEICLAEILSQQGYSTGHFGKWHLGTLTTSVKDSNRGRPGNVTDFSPPWKHGFQTCYSTEALMPTWWETGEYEKHTSRYWTGPDQSANPSTVVGDDSKLLVDQAISMIQSSIDRHSPFLAVIWFHTPHHPVVAGHDDRDRYPKATEDQKHYFASITAMDDQIGRLRSKLSDLGIEKQTMIWFCSDNGPEGNPGPQKRSQGTAGPLRGRKRSLYEGGIRVPGLLVWPEAIPIPRQIDVPCVTSDFFPTILDAIGAHVDDKRPYDGISLMPLIHGQLQERSRPIAFQFESQSALSDDRFKLVHNRHSVRLQSDNGTSPVKEWELFDLLKDSSETQDVSDQYPQQLIQMKATLEDWQRSCERSLAGHDDPANSFIK